MIVRKIDTAHGIDHIQQRLAAHGQAAAHRQPIAHLQPTADGGIAVKLGIPRALQRIVLLCEFAERAAASAVAQMESRPLRCDGIHHRFAAAQRIHGRQLHLVGGIGGKARQNPLRAVFQRCIAAPRTVGAAAAHADGQRIPAADIAAECLTVHRHKLSCIVGRAVAFAAKNGTADNRGQRVIIHRHLLQRSRCGSSATVGHGKERRKAACAGDGFRHTLQRLDGLPREGEGALPHRRAVAVLHGSGKAQPRLALDRHAPRLCRTAVFKGDRQRKSRHQRLRHIHGEGTGLLAHRFPRLRVGGHRHTALAHSRMGQLVCQLQRRCPAQYRLLCPLRHRTASAAQRVGDGVGKGLHRPRQCQFALTAQRERRHRYGGGTMDAGQNSRLFGINPTHRRVHIEGRLHRCGERAVGCVLHRMYAAIELGGGVEIHRLARQVCDDRAVQRNAARCIARLVVGAQIGGDMQLHQHLTGIALHIGRVLHRSDR